jgi:hypothetical protein
MKRTHATPTRPTPLTVAQASTGLTAIGLTALARLEAELAWDLLAKKGDDDIAWPAPPPRSVTEDEDIVWSARGTTGRMQDAMTFGRAA